MNVLKTLKDRDDFLNLIFHGSTFELLSQKGKDLFVKRKANSTIEQQKCKGHEKRDQILVLKMDLRSSGTKLPYYCSFLKLG